MNTTELHVHTDRGIISDAVPNLGNQLDSVVDREGQVVRRSIGLTHDDLPRRLFVTIDINTLPHNKIATASHTQRYARSIFPVNIRQSSGFDPRRLH